MKPTIALLFAILCIPGNTFAGELDPSPTQQKWFKHYAKQKNLPKPEAMLLNTKPEPDLTAGFTALFNGKDLNDWEAIGGTCTFEVQDGAIRGVCVPKSESTYLYTKKADFTDFIFTCGASKAEHYSIYGSYDDTCDAIQWGIQDTRGTTPGSKRLVRRNSVTTPTPRAMPPTPAWCSARCPGARPTPRWRGSKSIFRARRKVRPPPQPKPSIRDPLNR